MGAVSLSALKCDAGSATRKSPSHRNEDRALVFPELRSGGAGGIGLFAVVGACDAALVRECVCVSVYVCVGVLVDRRVCVCLCVPVWVCARVYAFVRAWLCVLVCACENAR